MCNSTGSGVGSFLNGLIRVALPIFRKSAVAIGRELLNVSSNVFDDVTENNVTVQNSLSNRGMEGIKNLKTKAMSKMNLQGNGMKRPRMYSPTKKRQSQSKSRKKTTRKVQKKKKKTKSKPKSKKKKVKLDDIYGYF